MNIKRVAVFGATGFQGRAQLAELKRQGYEPLAISRHPDGDLGAGLEDINQIAADYDDAKSLARALKDIDAVFFQAPALGNNERLLKQCAKLTDVIKSSNAALTVVNSSMWAPESPCGEIIYDGVLAMEDVFVNSGISLVIFRPTLFMNNLIGDWIKSQIVQNGVYHYPHKEDMLADWIALEDVAKFMVASLKAPDLVGGKFRIGGPERLTTLQMLDIISQEVGREVRHEYMSPRDFGAYFWELFGQNSGLERDSYIDGWDSFYTFNNEAPQKPFEAETSEALALLPISLTKLKDWAASQKWA